MHHKKSQGSSKTFSGDFYALLNKLKNQEHFAFARFSDGELFILQNKQVKITGTETLVDYDKKNSGFPDHDHKEFDPEKHQEARELLLKAFNHSQPNYFRGVSCRCCVGEENFKWQLNQLDSLKGLTWSNLLMNSNYPKFITEFLPELRKKKIVMVVNENADIENEALGLNVVKDFRVGYNCFVNDLDLRFLISNWIIDNNIEDHVFLFSAASLSNVLTQHLFAHFPKNTYMDIGTTLHPLMNLEASRGYLNEYWRNPPGRFKTCVW